MRRYIKTLTLALALVLTIAVLAACGMSNNPKKTKASLEEKQYTVETVIGDNDLDAQAECRLQGRVGRYAAGFHLYLLLQGRHGGG